METKLELICGVCWTIAYILIIMKSFKDKTYGMPFLAISLNIAWEFTFSFIHKPIKYPFAKIIFIFWFLLDCIILYTFIKYGYMNFKKQYKFSKPIFYTFTLLSILASVILIDLSTLDFSVLYNGDYIQTGGFIANIQNLIMSVLFVCMIIKRKNMKGQSILVGIFKWIGTLSIAILKFSAILPSTITEIFIIILIQLFDILYIYLLYKFSTYKNNN